MGFEPMKLLKHKILNLTPLPRLGHTTKKKWSQLDLHQTTSITTSPRIFIIDILLVKLHTPLVILKRLVRDLNPCFEAYKTPALNQTRLTNHLNHIKIQLHNIISYRSISISNTNTVLFLCIIISYKL